MQCEMLTPYDKVYNFPRYTHSHRAGCLFDPSSYIRPISQVEVAGVDSSVISSNFKCSEMSEMKYSIPYYDLWFKFLSFQNDKENIFILGVSHFFNYKRKTVRKHESRTLLDFFSGHFFRSFLSLKCLSPS